MKKSDFQARVLAGFAEAEAKVGASRVEHAEAIASLRPELREIKRLDGSTVRRNGVSIVLEGTRAIKGVLPREIDHKFPGSGKAGKGTYYAIGDDQKSPFWASPGFDNVYCTVVRARIHLRDALLIGDLLLEGYSNHSFDSPNLCRLTKSGSEHLKLPEGMWLYPEDAAAYAARLGFQALLSFSHQEVILLPGSTAEVQPVSLDIVTRDSALALAVARQFLATVHTVNKAGSTVNGCHIVPDIPFAAVDRLSDWLAHLPHQPRVLFDPWGKENDEVD